MPPGHHDIRRAGRTPLGSFVWRAVLETKEFSEACLGSSRSLGGLIDFLGASWRRPGVVLEWLEAFARGLRGLGCPCSSECRRRHARAWTHAHCNAYACICVLHVCLCAYVCRCGSRQLLGARLVDGSAPSHCHAAARRSRPLLRLQAAAAGHPGKDVEAAPDLDAGRGCRWFH